MIGFKNAAWGLSLRSALRAGACLVLTAPSGQAVAQTVSEATPNPVPGLAKRAGKGIEEVVVTAQRRSERLQNVPISITALSGVALTRAGVQSTTDLNAVVPSLNFTTSLGAYGLPTIRGIGSTSTGPGIENPVATYIDGVYMASPANALLSLHDISQVAVLKGPQGTLFGRNATGGLIQITTLDPGSTQHFDLDGSVGDRGYSAENVYMAGPVTDTLFANLAVSNDDLLGGFGKNLYNDESVQTHQSIAARSKVLWKPDDVTQVTLSADYANFRAGDPALRTIGLTAIGGHTPGNPFDIDSNVEPSVRVAQGGASLQARHDFTGFQMLSITAYRQNALRTIIDGDQTPISIPFSAARVENDENDSQISEELQFLSTDPGPFTWVTGLYYLHTSGSYDPATVVIQDVGTTIQNVSQYLDSYSAFAQGTYKMTPSTDLTAGIRYTLDHRVIEGTDQIDLGFATVPAAAADRQTKTFTAPSGRVSLDHRFSPEFLAYISYNRGFKSGTFSPQNFPVVEVRPETLNAYEGGIKTDLLDRRLRVNLSGFYYDYANKQVQQINNGVEYLYDAKKVTMYGFDSDIALKVTDDFQINGGVSAIHAVYSDFADSPISIPSPYGGNFIGVGNVSGNSVEDTPGWTLSIGPSYHLETSIGVFTANVNYYHNSGFEAAPDNRIRQPAYDLVNADLQFVPAFNAHISIDAWGRNITDSVYASQLNETQTGDNRVAAQGSTYGVTMGLHF